MPSGYRLQKLLALMMAGLMGLGELPLALPGSVLLTAAGVGMFLAVATVLPAAAWGARLLTARALHAE